MNSSLERNPTALTRKKQPHSIWLLDGEINRPHQVLATQLRFSPRPDNHKPPVHSILFQESTSFIKVGVKEVSMKNMSLRRRLGKEASAECAWPNQEPKAPFTQ